MSFWNYYLISGQTYTIDLLRTDDEGEGGGGFRCISNKSGYTDVTSEQYISRPLIPNANYQNVWVNYYDGWTITFNNFGSFDGGTAIAYSSQETYGGHGCEIAQTGVNWSNVELAINTTKYKTYLDNFNGAIVEKCPNLKYIALNNTGTYTGQTYNLRNSTAWTYESMQFTEWYCPGTTFIIENNSWWRQRIDWDIAEYRNVTFKDSNGNIIHR